jgi:hypothetical protein
MATERPATVTDDHLKFLDKLRKSGKTNMFGAPAYLQRKFGLDEESATIITSYWMHSFSERHPHPAKQQRAS